MLQVGDRMPAFSLRDPQRKEVTQEDFLGAPAVLAFYPMSFTGGCTLEMQGFQAKVEDFKAARCTHRGHQQRHLGDAGHLLRTAWPRVPGAL